MPPKDWKKPENHVPMTSAERQAAWRVRHLFDGKLDAQIKKRRMWDRKQYLAKKRAKHWEE